MLRLENISFAYDAEPVLREMSLQVAAGEFVGLIGPNSAGKSTLLRTLAGSRTPQAGKVLFDGRPMTQWSLRDLARMLTLVASEHYFAFPFTVEQVVLMGRTPYVGRARWESAQDRRVAEDAMHQADVYALRTRPVHQLSSGERQRVLLARAFAQETRVLLLDEPAAHLDLGHQWDLFETLRREHQRRKLTVVCALHDLNLAARYCDRLLVLKKGEIVAQGTPREILTTDLIRDVFGLTVALQWLPTGEPGLFVLHHA